MGKLLAATALVAIAGGAAMQPAQAGKLGVGLNAGSLGVGLEADYVLTKKLALRGQVNMLNFNFDFEDDGEDDEDGEGDAPVTDYKGKLKLASYGLLLDWHPFAGSFRLTAGGYGNANKLSGRSDGEEGTDYEIGDRTYIDSGDVELNVKLESKSAFAPYLGFGWGHSPANLGGFFGSFEIGVMFGKPKVTLDASGTATEEESGIEVDLGSNPQARADIDDERANLQDDVDAFKLYPVLTAGLGWRF